MSQSWLYHGLGVRGYRYVGTKYEGGAVTVRIELPREALRCPGCGRAEVFRQGDKRRTWRHLPLGGKPVFLELAVPRVWCFRCQTNRQVRVTFADEKLRHTRAFERYAWDLSRSMTIRDVARHLGVSWDTIKDIQKRFLQRHFARPQLKSLEQIASDEIAIGKGHRYVTLVLDLKSGAVVFVGDGKGADALEPFWKRLRASGAQLQAVAADLSPAYALAVRRNLPGAVLVNDRFHVVKLLHDHLAELRRELHAEAEGPLQKKVLKGTRWLLLKHPDHLDEKRNERQRLDDALALNHSLATAYYLKEDLRQVWEQATRREAERFLNDWIARAPASGIRRLHQFARTLQAHRAGILAWYDYPISTAPLEGTNNKIKTMKRQAYGFRDLEFFKLKILAIHRSKFALVG